MIEILVCFLLQIAFTIGTIALFGFLIAFCNRLFYMNFGSHGKLVCLITGFVGTPIHECAHALFCLIFGHKVTEIKLFQISSDDGTLGYVNHSYNPKNFYHRLGNFFIGVAPILVISAVLFLLLYLLMPNVTEKIMVELSGCGDLSDALADVLYVLALFFEQAVTWQWWVFILCGAFLALHMTLSKADIKGALDGLLFVAGAFLIADIVLGLVDNALLLDFTSVVLGSAGYLLCFMSIELVLSAVCVGISFLGKYVIRKRFGVV